MKHFILIDDNRLDNLVNSKVIEKAGVSLSLKIYSSGIDALEEISEGSIQENTIIVVDVQMPMMTGFEFVEKLQELIPNISEKASIYFLSSSIHQDDTERAKELSSVKGFLHKPFTEAIAKLKQLEF